jgi:hypothetical protein
MDPIKNFIAATDPVHNDPFVPDGEAALRRMLAEPAAFSDSLPPNVTSLADRKLRRARLAGVLTLTAAAVTAGVLIATNLGALTTAPEPANTGTVSATAVLTPTPTPTESATPTATPTVSPTSTPAPAAATGPVACTKDNVVIVQNQFVTQISSMLVSACAGEWMALTNPATENDEAESAFWMARLVDRRFVFDFEKPWATLNGWPLAKTNYDRLTAEEYMDRQFATAGIPVELRKTLVGAPPPGGLAASGIKTEVFGTGSGREVSFNYPAQWRVDTVSGPSSLDGLHRTVTNAAGEEVAVLTLGQPTFGDGCVNRAPYTVIDSQQMPGLPSVPAVNSHGTPRFVFVALNSEIEHGGPVHAGIAVTNLVAGSEGTACLLDLAVSGPPDLSYYSFTLRRPLGGPAQGLYQFNTMDEARAYTNSNEYRQLKAMLTSLAFTKPN